MNNETPSRYYWKCQDCLIPVVVDQSTHDIGTRSGMVCICGGKMELMGKIKGGNYWQKTESLCDCDERCTNARGPICDCKCHGENHGMGMSATHIAVVESGKVEVSNNQNSIELGAAWRELEAEGKEAYRVRWHSVNEQINNRIWVSHEAFTGQYNAWKKYCHIATMKVYKTREKKMREFIDEMQNNKIDNGVEK